MLIKCDKGAPMQRAISQWIEQFRVPNAIRLSVDIDPVNFF